MTTTPYGTVKFYSEFHERFLYFDDKDNAIMYQKHLDKMREAFDNPTEENYNERLDFVRELERENIFINLD